MSFIELHVLLSIYNSSDTNAPSQTEWEADNFRSLYLERRKHSDRVALPFLGGCMTESVIERRDHNRTGPLILGHRRTRTGDCLYWTGSPMNLGAEKRLQTSITSTVLTVFFVFPVLYENVKETNVSFQYSKPTSFGSLVLGPVW